MEVSDNAKRVDRILRLAALGEKPFDTTPAFPNLTHVSAARGDMDHNLSEGFFFPFLKFPAVRTISGRGISSCIPECIHTECLNPGHSCSHLPDLLPATSSITRIELIESKSRSGMMDLISACPNLESLKYTHAVYPVAGSSFLPIAFRHSLEVVKHTLQSVWLDYEFEHEHETCTGGEDHPLGSWKDFTVIKDLHLRTYNLLDHKLFQVFPTPLVDLLLTSLQSLHITDC